MRKQITLAEADYYGETISYTAFIQLLAHPDTVLWVAENAGKCIGHIAYRQLGEEAEVLDLAVAVPFRTQGYGYKLLSHACRELHQQEVQTLFLEARIGNATALKLYRSMGAQEIDIRKNYYQNPPEDAAVLALTLPVHLA